MGARAGAGRARGEHDLDLRELAEQPGQLLRARARGDDVEVLDAVGAATGGAGDLRSGARPAEPLAGRRRAPGRSPAHAAAGSARAGRVPRRRAPRSRTRTLSSSFGPSPFTVRRRCASAASRSESSESIPSSECSRRARFGPSPGRCVIATSPGGNFARSRSADGIVPVSISVRIFSWSVLPIPGSSVARPSRASAATDTGRLADRLGGPSICEHAVDDRAVELVEVAELGECVGDRAVGELGGGHRHKRKGTRGSAGGDRCADSPHALGYADPCLASPG